MKKIVFNLKREWYDLIKSIDASFAKGVNGQLEDTGCYLCGEL